MLSLHIDICQQIIPYIVYFAQPRDPPCVYRTLPVNHPPWEKRLPHAARKDICLALRNSCLPLQLKTSNEMSAICESFIPS
jgi:hypothetical protein